MKLKKNIKFVKLLSLVLVIIITGTLFAACSNGGQADPETTAKTTESTTQKEKSGQTIVNIYNAIIKGDYDYVYANSDMVSSDIEIFKQEVEGIKQISYVDEEKFKEYKGYELISLAADCQLNNGNNTNFSGIYILHNGKICSYSSIDDETMESINGYAAEYKKNSQFWREYGYDYYEETTIANYTTNRTICPICAGAGVVQEQIGMDANGIPIYGAVGCGGCGGSGYIN